MDEIRMKTATISGMNVFSTLDDQIMIAQSIPGKVDIFFKPFNFCLDAGELRTSLKNINRRLRAHMTCDLSNKSRGIINLEYNPLLTATETVEKFVGAVIQFFYEYEITDDEE